MLKTFFKNVFKKKSLVEVWFEVQEWFARGLVGVWGRQNDSKHC